MLQALIDYAKREKLITEPGFKAKTIRWLLVFDLQGRWLGVQDLKGEDKKSKGRNFLACPHLTQPEMVAAGRGTRHFLVDAIDKVTLLTKDGKVTEKLMNEHAFFVDLLRQASLAVPILGSIAEILANEEALQSIRQALVKKKAKATEYATFVVSDAASGKTDCLAEQDEWHDWWRGFRANLAAARIAKSKDSSDSHTTEPMRCILSGNPCEPAPTHNKITGLSDVGGLAMGDALTSFDKDAFASFDLDQGANAAMSPEMASCYTGALNHLIQNRSRRLAGSKIVYWYSRQVEAEDDLLNELFEGMPVDHIDDDPVDAATDRSNAAAQAESRGRKLLEAIHTGERPELQDARFYAMTISGNSGRVVIRDWMEGPFETLVEAITQWFDDLSIVARDGRSVVRCHKFLAVVRASVRDLKEVAAPLEAALWLAAVKRQPIPHALMAQVLHRVRLDVMVDESPRHARLGLLKAFLIRKGIPMTEELNKLETDPAYLCGRALSLLGRIQRKALGDVGAGVVQRYYGAASSTPALVLGRLVRTAVTGHLPKIEGKLGNWFDQQLATVWSKLNEFPPKTMTLEQQTRFAMGYYHQQAARYNKQGDADDESADTAK